MTDLEKAVAKWLPEMWTKRRCPSATPELGFRLLEAMLRECPMAFVGMIEGKFYFEVSVASPTFEDADLLTAITKAAAALAGKAKLCR